MRSDAFITYCTGIFWFISYSQHTTKLRIYAFYCVPVKLAPTWSVRSNVVRSTQCRCCTFAYFNETTPKRVSIKVDVYEFCLVFHTPTALDPQPGNPHPRPASTVHTWPRLQPAGSPRPLTLPGHIYRPWCRGG